MGEITNAEHKPIWTCVIHINSQMSNNIVQELLKAIVLDTPWIEAVAASSVSDDRVYLRAIACWPELEEIKQLFWKIQQDIAEISTIQVFLQKWGRIRLLNLDTPTVVSCTDIDYKHPCSIPDKAYEAYVELLRSVDNFVGRPKWFTIKLSWGKDKWLKAN